MKQYTVTGMSCAACSARVEKAVSAVEGVDRCAVSLLTNSMGVEGPAKPEDIIAAVHKAGYEARLKSEAGVKTGKDYSASHTDEEPDKETALLKKRLIASLALLILLMYVSMGHMMWGWPLPGLAENNHVAVGLLQLLITAAVMTINQKFFISGFKSLINRAPNMDALVALGSTAAFLYSTFALFAMTAAQSDGNTKAAMSLMDEFYFESAAMILTLITLGKMLEARSKGKTTDALKSLMKLAPKTATVIRSGAEIQLPLGQVVKGDVFVVKPGESIPVDGIVLEGDSAVDESALTGESIPVDKEAGSTVSSGTLNQSGFIKCQATRVGEDTTLSQIINMVSDAAATKAPIAKTADRVSGFFVPAVISIAAVTVAVWIVSGASVGFALARGISVLVISCPCALGLATPVAIMVGNGVGAGHGILFKTAEALELTGSAGIVVLDKTGTITMGRPKVTDIIPVNSTSKRRLLEMALALEKKSEHPLARAIIEKVEEDGTHCPEAENFRALPGNGLSGYVDGAKVLGGSYKFISQEVNVPEEMREQSERLSEQGKTPLFFSHDGELLGIIAVADVIKKDSHQAISKLHHMGLHVVMLTGDNEKTARTIGGKAGVDEVIAGVFPDGKEREIRKLQEKGKVIMVGDGINDAPALTRADIGIAIGAGADVAVDAADVVLMKNSLMDVPAAIRLSRKTLRNIRQNLFWAFFYNVLGIPLAAGVFINLLGWQLSPVFAAAAMSLSSFCVVTNALRLNLLDIYEKTNEEDKKMVKTMKIQGMMCGHCEAHTKKALEALDAVEMAEVSHTEGTAVVTLKEEIPDRILKEAVEEEGYEVIEIS